MSKRTCSVSRAQFAAKAKHLDATINGVPVHIPVKQFSTNSFGWYANGKLTLQVDGVPVDVQMGLTFTVIGSKELPNTSMPSLAEAQGELASVQRVWQDATVPCASLHVAGLETCDSAANCTQWENGVEMLSAAGQCAATTWLAVCLVFAYACYRASQAFGIFS